MHTFIVDSIERLTADIVTVRLRIKDGGVTVLISPWTIRRDKLPQARTANAYALFFYR